MICASGECMTNLPLRENKYATRRQWCPNNTTVQKKWNLLWWCWISNQKENIKKGTENKSVPKVRNEKKLKPNGQPKNWFVFSSCWVSFHFFPSIPLTVSYTNTTDRPITKSIQIDNKNKVAGDHQYGSGKKSKLNLSKKFRKSMSVLQIWGILSYRFDPGFLWKKSGKIRFFLP